MRATTRRKLDGDVADQLICDHALFHLEADLRRPRARTMTTRPGSTPEPRLIDLSARARPPAPGRQSPQWLADLLMGARLAASGGRDGLTRTAMTALGVGLGVAMLLVATAVPGTWAVRNHRLDAREPQPYATSTTGTLLVADTSTTLQGTFVRGRLVRPQGADAPIPPGLARLPAAGTAYVSPALRDLLASPSGAVLAPRVPYRIAGTIDPAGLSGPAELAYYAGSDTLSTHDGNVFEVVAFGRSATSEGLDPVLILLVVVIFVVLLLPVGVFIAAAVRFGGEQRDRRLAALRLVGADTATARRIAAGEALAVALLGLLAGGVLFLFGRQIAEQITIKDLSVYAGDIRPGAGTLLLVAIVVPALAVAVTLLARPRSAVRASKGGRRRQAASP
ncbi:MAG: hypothetical protein QOE51_20 [Actinoplanes sp.]|jgi:ABC-type antimicrobial peptide transport system permease subunit|nr:hypothetical protein [Actinoplanes sp.]